MLVKSTIHLDEYGRAEITPLRRTVHLVFQATGQELNLSPEDAHYLGGALQLHATELGYDPEK